MKHLIQRLLGFRVTLCLCLLSSAHAQDTVSISLPEAEKQFIQKNLQLLAEKYNIDIAKAQLIQSRLYPNPTLLLSGNLYDPANKKVFNVSNANGQYDVALQQLIRLAGKRNKEIKLAQTGIAMSENSFYDLLRTLRYSLRSSFYDLYFTQRSIRAYQSQISTLEKLNAGYETLQAKGVVTLKDAVRIKSLLYSLEAERASLQAQATELESALQLLLQNNKAWFIAEVPADHIPDQQVSTLQLASLIDTAYSYRNDLKLAGNNITYNQQNYRLQKAMATPDLTLGAEFDKRGSFVDNASFLTLGIDLPFFHRNQGNIRSAKLGWEQSRVQFDLQKQTVENEVTKAYSQLLNNTRLLQTLDPGFYKQLDQLLAGITENFQKKNLSLMELTDFYDSYKTNMLQLNQLQDQQLQAAEALQFAVGKTLFN